MALEFRIGRILFALGAIGFGLQSLLLGVPVMRIEGWITGAPGAPIVGYISGAVLVIGGVGLLFPHWAKLAAQILAAALACFIVLRLTKLIPTITQSDYWGVTFQTIAAFGASLALVAMLSPGTDSISRHGRMVGRICFGVALLVFAGLHYTNATDVEALIPAWISAHPVFNVIVGVASAAAGLAVLSGIFGRLAAALIGAMYASWVPILHIPRVLAPTHTPGDWAGLLVTVLLSGAAFIVAASFVRDAKP